MTKENVVTADGFAARLQCSKRQIFRLIDSSACPPPFRVAGCPRTLRWREAVIDAWIGANCPHCARTGWRYLDGGGNQGRVRA